MTTPPKAPASLLAHRIIRAASAPDATIAELAGLAEADPAFAMRVLRVVNSAAFGLQRKVTSIRQGCSMIGTRGLRSVALSLLVSDMAPVGRDGATVLAQVLRRAAAGGMVATRCGVAVDEGFLVGLLLEIGVLSKLREDPRAAEIVRMPALQRVAFELASGVRAHTDVGAELVLGFELPAEIADAVAGHHDASPRAGACARVAWAAERVAAAWEGGDLEEGIDTAMRSLCAVGFERSEAELALERLPDVVADAAAAFGLVMEAPQQLESLRRAATRALVEFNEGYAMSVRRLEALLKERVLLAAELSRANAELEELVDTDPLTGLASRRSLVRTMARDLARAGRSGAHLSVLRVDIDSFEAVSDVHGPIAGEGVLRAVADVLRGIVCSGDLASRLAGAEFAVLLPDTPLREAISLAERARVALAEVVVETPAGPIRITASVGAAARTSPDDDVDSILSRAHDALRSAGVRPVERAA